MNYIREYPFSALFYLCILLFSLLFSFVAQTSKNSMIKKISVLFLVSIISLAAGMRGVSVGKDTAAYYRIIELTSIDFTSYNYLEIGFRILINSLSYIAREPKYVILIISFITNALIISTLWKFRAKVSFTISVFCYITMFYFETFNILRQWLAIALIFFAFRYLFKSQYLIYVFFVIVAYLIHVSAIIGLVFIPIVMLVSKKISFKNKIFTVVSLFILLILINYFMSFNNVFEKYQDNYLQHSLNVNLGLYFYVRLFIILFTIYTIIKKDYSDIELSFNKQILIISIFGLLMSTLGYMYMFVGRISTYATSFDIILFSIICRTKSNSLMIKILVIIIGLYLFYLGLSNSSQGQMPYNF